MVFTQSQIADISDIAVKQVKSYLYDDGFLDSFSKQLADRVMDKIENRLNVLDGRCDTLEKKIDTLQTENRDLKEAVAKISDRYEEHTRRSMLRINGVAKTPQENIFDVVVSVIGEKCGIPISTSQINFAYRLNKSNEQKAPTIIVDLQSLSLKNEIFANKKKLKGTGIVMSENLSKHRYELFVKTKGQLGRKRVWTQGGKVFCFHQGRKIHVKTTNDVPRNI